MSRNITALPAASSPNSSYVVAADNSSATLTEKVTLSQVASAAQATLAQTRDLSATNAIVTPARLFDALCRWSQIYPAAITSGSGGSATMQPHQAFLDSTSGGGGFVAGVTNANGGPGAPIMTAVSGQGFDWAVRRAFCVRIYKESAASASGVGAAYFGFWTGAAVLTQPTVRSVGIELRGTAPRLWLIAHNGTSLTQFDTGWDVVDAGNEFVVESTGGTVNVYVNGTLRGTTTGGPTTAGGHGGVNYQVGNGGVAARTCYIFSQTRCMI